MTCARLIAMCAKHAAAAGRCLACCLLALPVVAWTQDDPLDVCLEGRGSAAINACNLTLEAGVDDLEVYVAFGRHLERANRLADATRLYREGLSRYPRDRTLTNRLKLAESNLEEQRFIERRKGTNSGQASAKAMFKVNAVRCRTLSGKLAIEACQEALSVEPDNPVFKRRLAELTPPPSRPAAPPIAPEPPAVIATPQPPVVTTEQAAEQEKQRAWTANIQRQLARLGYDPGPIDGLPGARTRTAIRELADQPGVDLPTTELGETLSAALDRAVGLEARALEQMQTAERQLAEGRSDGAAAALAQALAQAPWSRFVAARRAVIEQGIVELEANRRLAQARAEAEQRQRAIEALEREAEDARQRGDLAAAAQILEQALAQYPGAESLLARQRDIAEQQRAQQARELALAQRRRQEEAERLAREQALAEQRRLEEEQRLAAERALVEQRRQGAAQQAAQERALAEERRRREELAETAAREARLEQLITEARQAMDGGDFGNGLALVKQARELAVDSEPLARLEAQILGAQLLAEARAAFSRAQQLQGSGALPEPRLVTLKVAYDKVTSALEKTPASNAATELHDRIVALRTEVLAEAERLEEQRRRLTAAKVALREHIAQLAKVEAELAARELDSKLEAQRVLERMWH